jgi:hypothetical protein
MTDPKITTSQRVEQLVVDFREFVDEEKGNHLSVQNKLDGLSAAIQNQNIVEAGRQHLFDKIMTHDETLYGNPKTKTAGLDQRVDKLEELSASIARLTWIVVGEIMAAVAAGIFYLIKVGGD